MSVIDRRYIPGIGDIGCLVSHEAARLCFDLRLTQQPLWLQPNLVFLGAIESGNHLEAHHPIGRIHHDGNDGFPPGVRATPSMTHQVWSSTVASAEFFFIDSMADRAERCSLYPWLANMFSP